LIEDQNPPVLKWEKIAAVRMAVVAAANSPYKS
jgi:hypothetical protein